MKPWSTPNAIQILPVIVLLVSGCTYQLDVSYSGSSRQSPLRAISSMTVALEVEDVRPKDESDVVGAQKTLLGGYEAARYQTKKEVQTILIDALRDELESNGHNVILVGGKEADVRIVARIKKFWLDIQVHAGFWPFSTGSIVYIGTISGDFAVLNPRDGSIYGQRPIIGTFRARNLPVSITNIYAPYESAVNSALAEFIRSFSRDPELLEYLRLAQEEKKGK